MAPRFPRFRGDLIRGQEVDGWAGASGPFFFPPAAVAIPERSEDVATLVRWSVETNTPVVPRGAGSGMPGGNVGSGVVLDLTRLDSLRAGTDDRIIGGAGAIADEARRVALRLERDLPALPSSAAWCTLGGIAANNAAGARSFRYGPAHAWIHALEVVGRDGEVRRVRRGESPRSDVAALRKTLTDRLPAPLPWPKVRKNASGYALDRFLASGDELDLWIGGEGTLGVITGVELNTESTPPRRGVALLGVPERGLLSRWAALAEEVDATACEWFGARLLDLGGLGEDERLSGLRCEAGVVLVEVIGEDEGAVRAALSKIESEADGVGGVRTSTAADRLASFWALRHDASPRIEARAAPGLRSTQFIEDCVVPVTALEAWLDELDAILTRHGVEAVLFGHAGDGNIHVNPLLDLTDPRWRDSARSVLVAVADLTASVGGTLSGEHGDGRLRATFTERIWGAEMTDAFRSVKATFDPEATFNPGVILPLDGQDPLEGFGAAPDFAEGNRGPGRGRAATLSGAAR